MSITTELDRIRANRDTIRTKFVELGIATSVDTLNKLAAAAAEIINRGAVSVTVQEGDTYTIPAGYHNGSGTVSGVAGGGNYSLQGKTVNPTKKTINVTPDNGYYGLSDVTINPIPDNYQDVSSVTAVAGDVLAGKIIVLSDGSVVTGTIPKIEGETVTLDAVTLSYTIPKGYHSGTGKVTITVESKTVTPSKSKQTITPSTGKILSSVVVDPIPNDYITTTDANATSAEILSGRIAYVKGEKVEGAMPNNGAVNGSIDGISKTSYSLPGGYTTGGTITLTTDIEEALAAI